MVRKQVLVVLLLAGFASADTGFPSTIKVTETDNSPSCVVGQIKFGSGQVACSGQTATITVTGGSGGASSLEVLAGTERSSPTVTIGFPGPQFSGSVTGSSMTVSLAASSVTLQGQNVIFKTSTLQSGATFYVSSGTVNSLTMNNGVSNSEFRIRNNGSLYFGNSNNNSFATINNPGAGGQQALTITSAFGAGINQSPVSGVDLTLASQRMTGLTASQMVRTDTSKNLVSGGPTASEIPGGATSYIQIKETIQEGSTFYVNKGNIQGPLTLFNQPYSGIGNTQSSTTYMATNNTFTRSGITHQSASTDAFQIAVSTFGASQFSIFGVNNNAINHVNCGIGAMTFTDPSNNTYCWGGGSFVMSGSSITAGGVGVCLENGTGCQAVGTGDMILASTQTVTGRKIFQSSTTFSGAVEISSTVLLSGSPGSSGQVLTSGGNGAVPTWETPTSSGGGDNLGTHIATKTVTMDFGFSASTGVFTKTGTGATKAVTITSTGTSNALSIVDTGVPASIQSLDGGAVNIKVLTGTVKPALVLVSSNTDAQQGAGILEIWQESVNHDDPQIWIHAKDANSAGNIRIDSRAPNFEIVNTSTNNAVGLGKWEPFASANGSARMQVASSRCWDNTSFNNLAYWEPMSKGGGLYLLAHDVDGCEAGAGYVTSDQAQAINWFTGDGAGRTVGLQGPQTTSASWTFRLPSTFSNGGQVLYQATGSAPRNWEFTTNGGVGFPLMWQGTTSAPIWSNTFTSSVAFSGAVNISSTVLASGAPGTSGQVFTSGGAGAVPTWTTPSSGGGSATDLVPGDTDYIQVRETLQTGATFYVSSGTASSFNATASTMTNIKTDKIVLSGQGNTRIVYMNADNLGTSSVFTWNGTTMSATNVSGATVTATTGMWSTGPRGTKVSYGLVTGSATVNNELSVSSAVYLTELATINNPASDTLALRAFDKNGITVLRMVDSTGFATQLGRDNIVVGRNTTGGTLSKGGVVYVVGATGNVPNFALAISSTTNRLPAVGILAEDITNNSFGRAVLYGRIESINTSDFDEGDAVYVSTFTPGGFTKTKPLAPNFIQRVGIVLVSGSGNGSIEVDAQSSRPAVANCSNGTTDKLLYDAASDAFSCGTDQTAGGGGGDAVLAATQTWTGSNTYQGVGHFTSTRTVFVPTGDLGVDIQATRSATNGPWIYDVSQSTSQGLIVYNNAAQTVATANSMLTLVSTNTAYGGYFLRIFRNDGNSNGEIRIDAPAPNIEFVETDQTSPTGKFEVGVNNGVSYWATRNAADDSFERVFNVPSLASGSPGITILSTGSLKLSDTVGSTIGLKAPTTLGNSWTHDMWNTFNNSGLLLTQPSNSAPRTLVWSNTPGLAGSSVTYAGALKVNQGLFAASTSTFSGALYISSTVVLTGSPGSSGQVLTSGGNGATPTWATPGAGSGDNLGNGTGSFGVATTTGGFTGAVTIAGALTNTSSTTVTGAGGLSVAFGVVAGSLTANGTLVVNSSSTFNSNAHIKSGLNFSGQTSVASASFAITSTHTIILVAPPTAGGTTLTLPSASANIGQALTITKVDTSTHAVSIIGAGSDLIAGTGTVKLYANTQTASILATASGWIPWGQGIQWTPNYVGEGFYGTSANTINLSSVVVCNSFNTHVPVVIDSITVHGGTSNSLMDVGIYTPNGTRLASAGSTSNLRVGRRNIALSEATHLPPGNYFMCLVSNSITSTWLSATSTTHQQAGGISCAQNAGHMPLPATLPFPCGDQTRLVNFNMWGHVVGGEL